MSKTYTDTEVLMALRQATRGVTIRKADEAFGVTGGYIHDLLHGRRGITETIASRLGFKLVPQKPQPRKWFKQ